MMAIMLMAMDAMPIVRLGIIIIVQPFHLSETQTQIFVQTFAQILTSKILLLSYATRATTPASRATTHCNAIRVRMSATEY